MLFFVFIGASSAATHNVDPGTNTIKNAISEASPGDTLVLSNLATYNECDIVVDKNLTIKSPSSGNMATINAGNQGRVFKITGGATLTLKHLTIQNGDATKDNDLKYGGGIEVEDGGNVNINDCVIKNNNAKYGGGIDVRNGTVTLKNSYITKNTAAIGGGGICSSGIINIISSVINKNSGSNAGGIYITGTMTMHHSNINNNIATGYGGGIYNEDGICTITGSTISGNKADKLGAGIYNYPGTFTVTDSTISGNQGAGGSGIYNTGTLTVNHSAIINNSATEWGGGIFNNGSCTITGSSISGNKSTGGLGGGISNFGGACIITNCTINNNSAPLYHGGGVCNYTNASCTITGSTFNGNSGYQGAGICDINGSLTVTGCDFSNNVAQYKGNAIWIDVWLSNQSNIAIHYNRFNDYAEGYEIDYDNIKTDAIDAKYNWWGTNEDPLGRMNDYVDYSYWLVLTINVKKAIIGKNQTSLITADLTHDMSGSTHSINGLNIPIRLTTTLGTITGQIITVNGVGTANLNGESTSGIANVSALLDNQVVFKDVTIDTKAPKVSTSNPSSGKTGVKRNQTITVSFNENIKSGANYSKITLKSSTGKTVTITKSISGKVLTIKLNALLAAKTKYILTLYSGCVKDLVSNPLVVKTITFTTGSS